jgi:hypothetical protein
MRVEKKGTKDGKKGVRKIKSLVRCLFFFFFFAKVFHIVLYSNFTVSTGYNCLILCRRSRGSEIFHGLYQVTQLIRGISTI